MFLRKFNKFLISCDKNLSNFIYLVKGDKVNRTLEQNLIMNVINTDASIKTVDSKYLDECIFAIAKQDLSYMSELYTHTCTKVYSYSLSILKNKEDAEDVMHDTYMAVYESAYQYKSKGKPMAWIITIARNLAYAKLNDKKRYAEKDIGEYEYQFINDENLSPIDKITLETCLNKLSEEEREVVILHSSGFKHREIAGITNLSLSGVLSKYNRAIKKLKDQYEKGEI